MAEFVVIIDKNQQLVDLRRVDDATTLARLRTAIGAEQTVVGIGGVQSTLNTPAIVFDQTTNLIRSSTRIDDTKRAELFEIYNSFLPGDRFVFLGEQFSPWAIAGPTPQPKPLLFVMRDP